MSFCATNNQRDELSYVKINIGRPQLNEGRTLKANLMQIKEEAKSVYNWTNLLYDVRRREVYKIPNTKKKSENQSEKA